MQSKDPTPASIAFGLTGFSATSGLLPGSMTRSTGNAPDGFCSRGCVFINHWLNALSRRREAI